MKCRLIPILLLVGYAAQAASPPTFDAASVKISTFWKTGKETARESIRTQPTSLTMRNISLASAIKWAYGVKDYQISGPGLLYSERYDIDAKNTAPDPDQILKQMTQALLAERFKLTLHHENKDLPVYILTPAKTGPKLHKADPTGNTALRLENGAFIFSGTSMPQFAETLSTLRQVGRPVLDETGIRGTFDFILKFADSNDDMKRDAIEDNGPSIFALIQQQLGLKLEPAKAPIDMLVIDRVEMPTEN